MGYEFYSKVVPEEDLMMLLEINEKGFEFYFNLPAERRPKGYISYDFRIRFKGGDTVLINHKLTPLILNEEGNLWISLCLVTLSTAQRPGNMFILMQDEGIKYDYSFITKRFSKSDRVQLTRMEKKVLQFLALGFETPQIAETICVSNNTIKFHKRNIFKKLGAKNSNEAVYLSIMQTPFMRKEEL
jgi:DNA-binding CsgD family transcriptional regulator